MDLKKDSVIEVTMLLIEGKTLEGAKGRYWAGKFMVDKKPVPAKIWGSARDFDGLVAMLQPGKAYIVEAKVDDYMGTRQLIVQKASLPKGEPARSQFLPQSGIAKEKLIAEFDDIVGGIRDGECRELLKAFRKSRFFPLYAEAPAAKSIHHAWISGLIEHSLGLAKAVDALMPLYPGLDRSVLVTGAFLHDAGKVLEISCEPGFDYTAEGKLMGHIYMGAKLVEELIDGIKGFPAEKKMRIIHLILSHQGSRSDGFGSPVDPATPEAVFFHYLDNLDAKTRNVLTAAENAQEPDKNGFVRTDFPKMDLYLGCDGRMAADEAKEEKKSPSASGGLFGGENDA